jgi:hypothetical protein
MISVESICADLGIEIIAINATIIPMRTKARSVLRRILAEHGEGHLIITLRTIVESAGNECCLIAPAIKGVSDLILAHPK